MGSNDMALRQAVENLRLRTEKQNAAEIAKIRRAVVKIKVFGVGGGGNNVLKRLAEGGLSDIDLVAVNTDSSALSGLTMNSIRGIQIGANLTHGKGTGGNPELGEQAAKNDAERIRSMMVGADMIFITAAMGGGVGTGAAPIVANCQRNGTFNRRRCDCAFQVRGHPQTKTRKRRNC